MILDALQNLEERLPLMQGFYEKGLEVAAALSTIPGVVVKPNPPPAGTMHVTLEGSQDRLVDVADVVSREVGIRLVEVVKSSGVEGTAAFQIVVGNATMDIPTDEIRRAVALLQDRLRETRRS